MVLEKNISNKACTQRDVLFFFFNKKLLSKRRCKKSVYKNQNHDLYFTLKRQE